MCTADGTTFDLENILSWLEKHDTNPVNGNALKQDELIKLNFTRNDDGDYVDPVTFKVLTNNTHIVALKNTGNVFSYDTIQRLNIKAKMWRDLLSNDEFSRKDIIVLQDPQNVESRNITSFKYQQDGVGTLTEEQEQERRDPARNVNKAALGNAARIMKAKNAVALSRSKRDVEANNNSANQSKFNGTKAGSTSNSAHTEKILPFNAARHTTGKAAQSFTSTGFTPHTSADRALLSEEEYMLQSKRVKQKGYARISTNHGDLNVELRPEFAPHAVWNFVQLAKKGYYNGIVFHRNIRNFMIQGGDPTGTGRGGQSIWGKNFNDEFEGPATHDGRGVVSMANKGKNTNSSQFFITYRPAKHLDRKHTIFGQVVGGMDTLSKLENVPVHDSDKRPVDDIEMKEVVVLIDPFEEFQKAKREHDEAEKEKEEIARQGGTEDDRTTWTGKRIHVNGTIDAIDEDGAAGVGKYLKAAQNVGNHVEEDEIVEEWDEVPEEPVKKKVKTGGFGNFDNW